MPKHRVRDGHRPMRLVDEQRDTYGSLVAGECYVGQHGWCERRLLVGPVQPEEDAAPFAALIFRKQGVGRRQGRSEKGSASVFREIAEEPDVGERCDASYHAESARG